MDSRCVLLIAALAATTTAGPVRSSTDTDVTQCAVTCPTTTGKFAYTPGKSFEYRYESDVRTSMPGATAEHSSLHMSATVTISVISTCEMTMRLSAVTLQDSDPSNFDSRQQVDSTAQFRTALQSKPLSFAFLDGRIESVCPSSDEEVWIVNVKRGILSALQNTMTSLETSYVSREDDVSGSCPVRYTVTSHRGIRKVTKTKDLLGCTDRQSGQSSFQGMPYYTKSDIQSMPLMRSTHECEQEISTRSNIVTKSTCKERHVFRPFSNQESGATTDVTYKLTFNKQTNDVIRTTDTSRQRSTLLYDHTLSSEELAESYRDAQQTIEQLCLLGDSDVKPEVPSLFTNLVRQMRKLDSRMLTQLQSATKRGMCNKAEKFYRDAVPMLGTTASVTVMRTLLGQVSDNEAELWMASLAFVQAPSRDMLKELMTLMTSDLTRSALAVTSVVNTYCLLVPDCENTPEVQQILKALETELSYNCKQDDPTRYSRMLTALRAIGNTGRGERVASTLTRCIKNDQTSMDVRVAAITAYRRMDCSVSREDLFTLLENTQADSELRINAYLMVMECATDSAIQRVQRVLQAEDVNQVGSFIWTHLCNLVETASPHKQVIRNLLDNVDLKKEFDLDKRKFSRNIEVSAFSKILNVGAGVESNLIWSTQSYLPRSASLNLTVDMFGQSVNLLEVGGRAQGLESFAERMFGPGGELSNELSRPKRAVIRDDVLNTIDRKFPMSRDDAQLSMYLRVFGNEIKAADFKNLDTETLKNRFNFLDILIQLSEDKSIDFSRSVMLADSSLVIPTIVGMPLRLGVDGSAAVSVSAKGKLDIRQMFTSPSTFDIGGSMTPSAALEIRAEMSVDAHLTRTGLKMVNRLHTSTVLDGRISLKDGRMFAFDVNTPRDQMDVFTAESHFYVTYRGADREQTGDPSNQVQRKSCSGQTLTDAFGMEMCGELTYFKPSKSAPVFPLSGPITAKVTLNKRDTQTGIHFEASLQQLKDRDTGITDLARVSFNTPGSRVDRELTAELRVSRNDKTLKLDVKTPWKKLNVNGALTDTPQLKRVTLTALLDESQQFSLTGEVQVAMDDKKQEMRFTPLVQVVIPGRETIVLDGTAAYTSGKKAEAKISLRNAFKDPVSVEGVAEIKEQKKTVKYETSVKINSAILTSALNGYVSNNREAGNSWASRADLTYQYRNGPRERVVINHKLRDMSTSNLRSYSMGSSWTTTMLPRYNGQFGVEFSFSASSLRTHIDAELDSTRKVTVTQTAAYDFTSKDKKLNAMLKLEVPFKSWDYETKVDHVHNSDSLMSNVTVKYATNRKLTYDLGLKRESIRPLSVMGDTRLTYPGRDWSAAGSVVERAPREYTGELNVQLEKDKNVRVTSLYKMTPRHELTAEVSLPDMDPITLKGHLNPILKNMAARVEAVYKRQTYMADTTWLHRPNGNAGFNTQANMQVSYPGRNAALRADVSRRNIDYTVNVEGSLSDTQKVKLNSLVTVSPSNPKAQVRLDWSPNNFVAVVASSKYETQGWYTTTNDLEANVKVTSSFRNFEELGASVKHDQAADSVKTSGEVSWGSGSSRKITGELAANRMGNSWNSQQSTLSLRTPFSGYRSVKAELTSALQPRSLSLNKKITWDNQQMSLTINADAINPSRLVNARATFTSPFRYAESLSTGFKYELTGNKYQTSADVTWAPGAQISAVGSMTHQQTGQYGVSNNGELTVTSPFRGYQNNKLTWSHQSDDSSAKCHHELSLDDQKYVFDLDGSHRLTRPTRRVIVKSYFQSPHDGFDNIRLNVDYQHDRQRWKGSSKNSLTWSSTGSVSLEHDVNVEPGKLMTLKAKLTTPVQLADVITLDMNNRLEGTTYTATNELTVARGKYTVGGTLNLPGGPVFSASARLTTPHREFPRASVTVSNTRQQDGVWTSHADLEYAPDNKYSVDGRLGWQAMKTFGLEVTSPHDYMRSMKCNANLTMTSPYLWQTSAELQHNMFRGRDNRILATAKVDFSSTRNAQAQVTLRTPFPDVTNFKATFGHVADTRDHCLTTGTYELNRYRGTASHDMTYRAVDDWKTKTEVEYINNKKLELNAEVKSTRGRVSKVTASANFKSPFDVIKQINANYNHEGVWTNFKVTSDVSYNVRDKYTGNVEFGLTDTGLRSTARFTTPIRHYERLTATVSHVGTDVSSLKSEAVFELNDQKLSASQQFSFTGSSIKLSSRLDTPWRPLTRGEVEFSHDGFWDNFNNNLVVKYNDKQITTTSQFSKDGPTAKLQISTPYTPLRTLNMDLAHSARSWTDWSNTFNMELNGNKYNSESELKLTADAMTAKVVSRVPEEYSVRVSHEGPWKSFTHSTTVLYGGPSNKVTATATFSMTSSSLTGKAQLQTPFNGYEKFELRLNHNGTPSNGMKSTLTLTTSLRAVPKVSAELTHRGVAWRDVSTTLQLDLPVRSVPRVTLTLANTGDWTDMKTEASVTYGKDTIATSVTFNLQPRSVRGSATLRTPFQGAENFELSFSHSGVPRDFTCSASVTTPWRGYETFSGELTHKGDWKSLTTSGKVETSVRDFPKLTFNIEHTAPDYKQINTAVKIGMPAGDVEAKLGHSSEDSGFKTSVELNTPYRRYERFSATASHEGGYDSPKTSVTIQTPIRGYDNFGVSTEKTGNSYNMQMKGELTTPFSRFQRTAVSWSHNIDAQNRAGLSAQVKGQVETSYPGWEKTVVSATHTGNNWDNFRSGAQVETSQRGYEKFSLNANHAANRRGYKGGATLETSVPGYNKFGANFDHSNNKRTVKTTVNLETPVRGYEKFGVVLDHTGDSANSFQTALSVNTPLPGYNNMAVSVNHNGEATDFLSTAKLTTPFLRGVPQIDLTLKHKGTLRDFSTVATAEYATKKTQAELSFRQSGPMSFDGKARVTSPYDIMRDVSMEASHATSNDVISGATAVTYNGEKKVDYDYTYQRTGQRSFGVNLRSPYPMSGQVSATGDDAGSAVVNWDTTASDRSAKFDFSMKNVETSSSTERGVSVLATLPQRTAGFNVAYTLTADKFTHKAGIQLDNKPDRQFAYELEATKTSRRGVTSQEGKFKMTSSVLTAESTLTHRVTGKKHLTEVTWLSGGEKLSVKSDLTLNTPSFTNTITVQFPRFSKDVTLVTEGTIGSTNGNVKTTLSYERETFTLEGRATSEDRRDGEHKTSALVRFTHPNSQLDTQLGLDVSDSREATSFSLEGKFLATDGQTKVSALRSQINKLRREMNMELVTPLDTVKVAAVNRVTDDDSVVYGYDVTADVNSVSYRASVDINVPDRSAQVKLYNTPTTYLQMSGQYVSPTDVKLEVFRVGSDGQRADDIVTSWSMGDDRLLSGRVFFRAGIAQDLQTLTSKSQNNLFMDRVERSRQAVMQELNAKRRPLLQATQPITDAADVISRDVGRKMSQMTSAIDTMYRNNEFYMRDVAETVAQYFVLIARYTSSQMREVRRGWDVFCRQSSAVMSRVSRELSEWSDGVTDRLTEWNRQTQQKLNRFSDYIKGKLMDLVDRVRSHPRISAVVEKLSSMDPADYFLPPSEWQNRLSDKYSNYVEMAQNKWNELNDRPAFRTVKDWTLEAVENSKWVYELLGLEDQFKTYLGKLRTVTWDNLRSRVSEALQNYLQLDKNKWTIWEPRRSEFAFQLYVPFELPDMTYIMNLDIPYYVEQLRDWVSWYTPDDNWSVWDTFYKYKPSRDVNNWIPPFKANAAVWGAQHYMTFDKRFYEFAGECSYLLARDFIDGTFSVIVNYDRVSRGQPVKKSITVISDGKQVELQADGKVTVDGTRTEMPVRLGNTTVMRSGNTIRVVNDRGVNIVCDLPHDHCAVNMAGWYFGKTAGLLGTYDNEPATDFTTIDRTRTDKPEVFADSWKVGTSAQCRPINRAVTVPRDINTRRYQLCAKYFADKINSPFRMCFTRVEPDPFMTMCLNDVTPTNENRMETEEDICKVAASFLHECRAVDMHLRMPKQCVRCAVPVSNKVFVESEPLKLQTSAGEVPRSADVVFVVQHSACNKDVLDRAKGLVDDLEKAMRAEGLRGNRYAVVGYGGRASHLNKPHTHTMDAQTFNTADKISLALDKFDLEAAEDTKSRDAMLALRYAAKLSFRAGVSKTIILIPCDTCVEQSATYNEIQQLLLNSDIRLTVLVQDTITLKSRSPKTAYIFGVDEQTVYTRKDVAGDDLSGEPDLRRYVRLPKDLCVALTQDTDGAVFSAKQWIDSRPVIQKRFVDVMVRTLARKATPSECQVCECVADETGSGISQCHSCQTRNPIYALLPNLNSEDFGVEEFELETTTPVMTTPRLEPARPIGAPTKKPNASKPGSEGVARATTRRPLRTTPARPLRTTKPKVVAPPKKVVKQQSGDQ